MKNPKVFSIGFEGSHRSGKGTNIELLKNKLEKLKIPFIIVRGSGTRPNEGEHIGDPISDWWTKKLPLLRREGSSIKDWNESSYRLARELIVFRDRVLPNMLKESSSKIAFLLVDRSILSETMITRESENETGRINLYPDNAGEKGKVITAEMVCPDILFNFIADKETLLLRLDKSDPKYEFRRKLIEEKSDWYKDAKDFIPNNLKDRVIEINATKTLEEIQEEIMKILSEKIPDLKDVLEDE